MQYSANIYNVGYKNYSKNGESDKSFVQIYDGYSNTIRYIDWQKFDSKSNITRIIPPIKPKVIIRGGTTINDDFNNRGKSDILPMPNHKVEM